MNSIARIKMVADESIPGLDSIESWADIHRLPGRSISAKECVDADCLLVRSVTAVDATLLSGTAVRMVGSATAGCDHVDQKWLEKHGIHFCHAPGCNANAVVDYVMSCILHLCSDQALRDKTIGIVGYGNIGRRLAGLCAQLGLVCRVFDPLILRRPDAAVDRFELMLDCDILTFHVPLSIGGRYSTYHQLDGEGLARLRHDCIVINSSRGAAIDNVALAEHLKRSPRCRVALDVWENEPAIAPALLRQAAIATPHIAGYSRAGKLRGSVQVLSAVARFFGESAPGDLGLQQWVVSPCFPQKQHARLAYYRQLLKDTYCAFADSQRFASACTRELSVAALFDQQRRDYPHRPEIVYRDIDEERTSP